MLKDRIQTALKREAGIRLTPAEVQALASALRIGAPEPRRKPRPVRVRRQPKPAKQERLEVHIRWMIRADMSEVLRIESECFADPWDDEAFIKCLRQRNCIGMVAEHNDRVLGFMIYELHKSRLELLNFAVAKSHQMRDIGRQMLRKLQGKLSTARRQRILLHVREGNYAGQKFFSACGFQAVSTVREYYDNGESAYAMECPHEDLPHRRHIGEMSEPEKPWNDSYGDDDGELLEN